MGGHASCAPLPHHVASHELCRPDPIYQQESVISWFLVGHTTDHAHGFSVKVGSWPQRYRNLDTY